MITKVNKNIKELRKFPICDTVTHKEDKDLGNKRKRKKKKKK